MAGRLPAQRRQLDGQSIHLPGDAVEERLDMVRVQDRAGARRVDRRHAPPAEGRPIGRLP